MYVCGTEMSLHLEPVVVGCYSRRCHVGGRSSSSSSFRTCGGRGPNSVQSNHNDSISTIYNNQKKKKSN